MKHGDERKRTLSPSCFVFLTSREVGKYAGFILNWQSDLQVK